ncbi:MAG TPA: fused MFS/spermidine synthase, partial [Polyangiaceae bacterium]
GALFSHLCRSASAAGVNFGRALGINTLAAAAAPALFGVVALPALGAKVALLLIVVGYLAAMTRRAWSTASFWLTTVGSVAFASFAPALVFIDIPPGGHVVSYQDGVMAAVSVVEDADGVARLRINNRQQEGSSNSRRVDGRQAWLPLLFHPAPSHALFLGLGTGVTSASAAEDPALDVDVVELLPEVIAASRRFTADSVAAGAGSRLHVLAADARRYVRASERRYDVIVSDNFHPARSGSGALYTVEHFQAVRARLGIGGVVCQWLPLHQLDLATLRSIAHSFVNVYPRAWLILASNSLETPVLGLLAKNDEQGFDVAVLRNRLSQSAIPKQLTALGFDDEFSVLGGVLAGPKSLAHFVANSPVNTDDRPGVMNAAPRGTSAAASPPRARLIELLHDLSIEPAELLVEAQSSGFGARLAAYWAARDRFIESGRDVRASGSAEQMLAQVREPLLSVLRISPDFRPAYDPLLSMAQALARSDVSGAKSLLTELTRLSPARGEATRTLSLIAPAASDAESVRH